MFGRNSERRKLEALLRRVIDQSTPNQAVQIVDSERRCSTRYSRNLPVLVVPIDGDALSMQSAEFVISRDLSDSGISLIHAGPIDYQHAVIGILMVDEHDADEEFAPIFVVGEERSCRSIGGGFYQTAFELTSQVRKSAYLDGLEILAQELIPSHLRTDERQSPEPVST